MESATRRRARGGGAAFVLLLAILAMLLVRCSSTGPPSGTESGSGHPSGQSRAIRLTGQGSRQLAPGASAPVNLRLTSSASFPVSVTRLTVSIHAVDAPRSDAKHPCTAGDFDLRQSPPGLTVRVAASASSTLLELGTSRVEWPRVVMLDTSRNQDGCKGASVALDFRAFATRAPR
jgi:hypothetical protein